MNIARNITKATLFSALLVTGLATASLPACSQETAAPYSQMAPIDEYLIADRNAEIAMARSAAPPSISADADVRVLAPAVRSILPLSFKRTELVLAGGAMCYMMSTEGYLNESGFARLPGYVESRI